MKKIYSGTQPTGIIHLGNYFGAIYNWVQLQRDYDCMFCIVDMHALTVYQKPEELNLNIKKLTKLYLACGLDPKKNIIYRQSDVPEHTELAWILDTITPMSELERMTQYKDKSTQHKDNINAGLFTYPVLMASDILLYDTDVVPVGEDQIQHVELARIIAKKFNNLYGDTFVLPEVKLNKVSARLKGLDNPEKKMSKSATSEYNYISLTDEPKLIEKKIMKAITDSGTDIKYSRDRAGLSNLMDIYSLITTESTKEIEKQFEGKGYGDFKKSLSAHIINYLKPIQERYNAIEDNELEIVLNNGAKLARERAQKKIKDVKHKIGL